MIIYNSLYLPANIGLWHVTDETKYAWLTNCREVQEAHVEMNCQIQSHVDSVNLCYPHLYSDRFKTLQINSSDLEIFMSLEGEKYPRNRTDFVSRDLEFLFPSVYRVPSEKHLHPALQEELRPELFRWLIQVTSSPRISRHSLSQGFEKT